MIEDTKSTVKNAVRTGVESNGSGRTEAARESLDRRAESVRDEFERRKGETKQELGKRLFDLGEEYFPEEAARRRRRVASVGVVVGFAAGFVARHLLDR
jgi:hypothetical protein